MIDSISTNHQLKSLNTFGISATCKLFYEFKDINSLKDKPSICRFFNKPKLSGNVFNLFDIKLSFCKFLSWVTSTGKVVKFKLHKFNYVAFVLNAY